MLFALSYKTLILYHDSIFFGKDLLITLHYNKDCCSHQIIGDWGVASDRNIPFTKGLKLIREDE